MRGTTVNDTPGDGRETRRWAIAIGTLFALGGFALSSWATRLPTIREQLGLTNDGLGLLLAATTLGSGSGLIGAPLLLRRVGARTAMSTTAISAAAGVALVAVAAASESLAMAVTGLALAGFGIGATDVLINIDGAFLEKRAGRSLLPLMHAAWPAGAVLSALLASLCSSWGVGPAAQLLTQAAIIAVLGTLAARSVLPGRRGDMGTSPLAPEPGYERRRRTERRLGLLDPRLLAIGVVMLAAEMGEGAANNWLTVASTDALGFTESVGAVMLGVYSAAQVVVRVLAGPLVDRYGRTIVLRITTIAGALGVVLFIADLGVVGAVIGASLWSFGVALGFPLGMSAAAEGEGAAARVTAVASLGYVAGFVGPPLIGFGAQQVGILWALLPIALLFAVSSALAPSLRARAR